MGGPEATADNSFDCALEEEIAAGTAPPGIHAQRIYHAKSAFKVLDRSIFGESEDLGLAMGRLTA